MRTHTRSKKLTKKRIQSILENELYLLAKASNISGIPISYKRMIKQMAESIYAAMG